MPGDNKQTPKKQTSDSNKIDLRPLSLPSREGKRNEQWAEDELLAEDDPLASNPPRPSTSAIRWHNSTTGRRLTGTRDLTTETIRQQVSIPPRRTAQTNKSLSGPVQTHAGRNTTIRPTSTPWPLGKQEHRNVHWMLYVGVGMLAALALWATASSLLAWGTSKYDDFVYGNPRFYQTDYVVDHNGDSKAHPSHFIALNLHGQVLVIELPAGDPTKSIDYIGPALIASGDELIPITLTFSDVNKDNKPDMIIHIEDKEVYFCNNGTKFTACNS
jgi:hypothetical protein